LYPCELGGDPPERLLPDPVRRYGIGLVAHGDAGFPVHLRPLECSPDDALDSGCGIDLLGHVVVPGDAAAAEVDALRVLAKNDEVDATIVTAQRCEFGVEQPYRAEIDVQVELEAQAEQNIPGMLVPGDSRVADRPRGRMPPLRTEVHLTATRERLAAVRALAARLTLLGQLERRTCEWRLVVPIYLPIGRVERLGRWRQRRRVDPVPPQEPLGG